MKKADETLENDNSMLRYSEQWEASSKNFYNCCDYQWMCDQVKDYGQILEIGCGVGYSTLAILENNHKVVSVEKNPYCVSKTVSLINEKNLAVNASVIEGDITNDKLSDDIVNRFNFDIVVCWNIGTHFSTSEAKKYIPLMIEYGLTPQQIKESIESSYGELIIYDSCKIAEAKGVPINFIDRGISSINENNDQYYCALEREFGYSHIFYSSLQTKTVSEGGRILSVYGQPIKAKSVDVFLNSVLIS